MTTTPRSPPPCVATSQSGGGGASGFQPRLPVRLNAADLAENIEASTISDSTEKSFLFWVSFRRSLSET